MVIFHSYVSLPEGNLWMIKGFRTWDFSSRHLDILFPMNPAVPEVTIFRTSKTLQTKTEIGCSAARADECGRFWAWEPVGTTLETDLVPRRSSWFNAALWFFSKATTLTLTHRKSLGISSVKEKEPSSCLNVCLKRPWRKTQSHQPSKSWPNASECESESETKVQSW